MVKNQMQWVQLTMDNIAGMKSTSLKHYSTVTQEAERFYKETHKRLEDSEKVLKQNVDIWTDYIANGTKVILPLPSISQTISTQTQTCSGCGKVYKTERRYITHKQECKEISKNINEQN